MGKKHRRDEADPLESVRKRQLHISIYWLLPTFVLALLLGAFLALSFSTANLANWAQWARDFAKSPGAAAFAALIAALIALLGISRQVSVSRATLEHQREVARSDTWWETFEWTSNRALPSREGDEPLPTSVTISTLEHLADAATSDVQRAACAGIIEVLTLKIEVPDALTSEDLDVPKTTQEDTGAATLAALASYVESNRGTAAASRAASALVYQNEVLKALTWISWNEPSIKLDRMLSARDTGPDAIAEVDGRPVGIEIKAFSDERGLRQKVQQILERSIHRESLISSLLLITPFPSPIDSSQESEMGAAVTHWRTPADNGSLLAALRRASQLK